MANWHAQSGRVLTKGKILVSDHGSLKFNWYPWRSIKQECRRCQQRFGRAVHIVWDSFNSMTYACLATFTPIEIAVGNLAAVVMRRQPYRESPSYSRAGEYIAICHLGAALVVPTINDPMIVPAFNPQPLHGVIKHGLRRTLEAALRAKMCGRARKGSLRTGFA